MAEQRIQNLETDVDKLMEYLKEHGKSDLKKVARDLGVEESVIQSWVDFLVEEKVLGVEYSLTKPYIFLLKTKKTKHPKKLDEYKKEFKYKADKKVPEKTAYLWKSHVMEVLERKKDFFYDEARRRGFADIDSLWDEYKKKVGEVE